MTHLALAFTLTPADQLRVVVRIARGAEWATLDGPRDYPCDGATPLEKRWHACLIALHHAGRVAPNTDHTQQLTVYSDLDVIDQLTHYQEFQRHLMDADTQAALFGFNAALRALIEGWGGKWSVEKRGEGFLG
jgi:hypothetical protein